MPEQNVTMVKNKQTIPTVCTGTLGRLVGLQREHSQEVTSSH